jgi:hypothetical protein
MDPADTQPLTRENDYGFVPPAGQRSTVAEINSYENPWPQSTEDFSTDGKLQKTHL